MGSGLNLHGYLDFTFCDDKNMSMVKQCKKITNYEKIALGILDLLKESYKIRMKRIRYELSLDYENEIEKMLLMLDVESVKRLLCPE